MIFHFRDVIIFKIKWHLEKQLLLKANSLRLSLRQILAWQFFGNQLWPELVWARRVKLAGLKNGVPQTVDLLLPLLREGVKVE